MVLKKKEKGGRDGGRNNANDNPSEATRHVS